MTNLFAARSQMAISLAFHIIFAAIGTAMPFLMATAHYLALKNKNAAALKLTKAWAVGVAIFFATGAVSGTVLSFELGLLWPEFMKYAGPIIGMPFSLEGTAFFLEAVALGIFLYGWERVPKWWHWASGLLVGVCGVLSALFVICANAWMNSPRGFTIENGLATHIEPYTAMFNPFSFPEGLHMVIASFCATGFAVAGLHALALLKHPRSELHKLGLKIALVFAAVAAIAQPLQGDRLAKSTAVLQPGKLAAMEALFKTSKPAPLLIGGIPDEATETVRFGIHLPHLLSFLAHGDFNAEVKGLDAFAKDERPPVLPVHLAFQFMVAVGTLLGGVGAIALFLIFTKNPFLCDRRLLMLFALLLPFGFMAIEAGWVVTEVGRQPWVIFGFLKTKDAVTPMPGLQYPMALFTGVYVLLSAVVAWLMSRQFRNVH